MLGKSGSDLSGYFPKGTKHVKVQRVTVLAMEDMLIFFKENLTRMMIFCLVSRQSLVSLQLCKL